MSEPENKTTDHGEVVARPGLRISWAWLFPILAALAAGWLFWSDWKSQGPEIEVEFATAPGIEPGKTNLVYRGVVAGTVKSVRLDEKLQKVVVSVRLKAFASDLAREGTLFWIDQPVIGLGRTSGIESLIQGNSLKARMGQGPPALHFTGSEVVPLSQLEEPGMLLTLNSANVPFLDRGSPIYHRGVMIGAVRGKTLNSEHQPVLNIMIEKEFTKLVTSNSRFWSLPAASVKLGSGMVQIDLAGLKSLLLGAITMECFGEPGTAAKDGDEFVLSANEFAARASSSPIRVTFLDGLGVRPGITELRYRGIPVGLVETVSADVATGEVATTVRLAAGYESLRGEGAAFTLVRPRVSLEGISGIETLIAGIYIDCAPGDASRPLDRFAGLMATDSGTQEEGLTVQLHAKEIPTIDKGAPVLLRGIIVGSVTKKTFDENNEPSLTLMIRKEFARTLASNAKFWRVPATSVEAGPGVLNVEVSALQSLWKGGVAFDVFGMPGEPAGEGAKFELFASERIARAGSPPIRIEFPNGQGLLAGQTQLRYLGIPVGIVEDVKPVEGKVVVTARLDSGYDLLRRKGSEFSLVRPKISLQGVSGLETLVSGVYIECTPGSQGPLADRFRGVSPQELEDEAAGRAGFQIVVQSPSTSIGVNAPVFYRGVQVGKIVRKALAADGTCVGLIAVIDLPYAPLLRENTKFWDVSGVRASLGLFAIKIQTGPLKSLALGGIEFATPPDMGRRVKPGHTFPLSPSPQKDWLRWSPAIPLTDEK
ncbi:MAG: MlaD family protein [Verrucomicrobia bacterium]|nr:MlaD family protein [Verrucomicrobiota bacterium]